MRAFAFQLIRHESGKIQARIQDFEMGVEFLKQCIRTNQYLRDKKNKRKKGAQKKGGENSPISPPLDPRLIFRLECVKACITPRGIGATHNMKLRLAIKFPTPDE